MELELDLATLDVESSVPAPLLGRLPAGGPQELAREVMPLTAEDLEILALSGPEHALPQLKQIRARHHMVALRLATGEKPIEISRAMGITPGSITRLQKDPQFDELVKSYRDQAVDRGLDMAGLISTAAAQAVSNLIDRLSGDEADEISTDVLRRIAEGFVDRSGHSPVRRSETTARHSLSLSNNTIDRIKSLHSEENAYIPAGGAGATLEIAEEAESSSRPLASLTSLVTAQGEAEAQLVTEEGPSLSESGDEDAAV